MKVNKIYEILFVIGIGLFIIPIVSGLYKICLESWKMFDWLIMYSYIYWPTYLIGIIFIVFSIYKLKK